MKEPSSRMMFVAICAWMSVCLLLTGWLPELTENLRVVWMWTGVVGLLVSVGLSEVVKRELQQHDYKLKQYMTAAFTDGLTGLGNRQALDRILDKALGMKADRGDKVSLIMIDVDHFKAINDTHGHQTGDHVLRSLARTAEEYFTDKGAVTRYGGEEFAVACMGAKLSSAIVYANEFRELIHKRMCVYQDMQIRISVSLGVAEAMEEDRPEELVERADTALYSAKRMGRNCVWFADPNSDSGADLIVEAINNFVNSAPPPTPPSVKVFSTPT